MSRARTTTHRRRTPLVLVTSLLGAAVLLTGCGDGAHMPAGTAGTAALAGAGSGSSTVDRLLGIDPGAATTGLGVRTGVDDPILSGYDGIDSIDALGADDPWSQVGGTWANAGDLMSAALDDEPFLDDGPMPVGYGGFDDGWNTGWGSALGVGGIYDSYGFGGSVGAAAFGGFEDPAMLDTGLDDVTGFFDDPSLAPVADVGFDPGPEPMIGGFDAGFVDSAPVDVGGFDGGFIDAAPVDVGGFDTGGFDVGGFDVGGMDAGLGF